MSDDKGNDVRRARGRRRNWMLVVAVAPVVLLLAGCSAVATAPKSVGATSATMQALISCNDRCQYRFRYRTPGGAWKQTAVKSVGAVQPAQYFGEELTGLTTGTAIQYQVCSIGDQVASWTCQGPTGPGDWITFTPAAPIPAELSAHIEVVRRGKLGRAILDLALSHGTTVYTADGIDANYNPSTNKIKFGRDWLSPGYVAYVPGLLAHEFGHSNNEFEGVNARLRQRYGAQPFGNAMVYIANELVAEMLASAAAVEAGWYRGPSSVTTQAGTLRTPRGAVDWMMNDSFYQDYYGYTGSSFSEAVRNEFANAISAEARALITRFGGAMPSQYTVTY